LYVNEYKPPEYLYLLAINIGIFDETHQKSPLRMKKTLCYSEIILKARKFIEGN